MTKLGAIALATTLAATAAQAAGSLEISQPWSRPAVAGTNGVGFMTLANKGKAPDALTAASSPLAKRVEIHRSSTAGGVMTMAKQARVAVPAGGTTAFAPAGYHLMFIGLTRTVKAGDRIPANLTFASGAKLKADFVVGTGLSAPMHMDHAGH